MLFRWKWVTYEYPSKTRSSSLAWASNLGPWGAILSILVTKLMTAQMNDVVATRWAETLKR